MSLVGLGYSHLFRRFAQRRGWSQLGILPLIGRVIGAAVVLGVTLELTQLFLWKLTAPPGSEGIQPWLVIFFSCNLSILYALWMIIYFAVHFFERWRRAEVERWQLKAAAQVAELRSLKAQMNPHFLFNCLNSLRALIAEDPARAQLMVTQLAGLLRYSLASADDQTVSLERELGVVRDYLALESVRFEERLRVRMDIQPESLQIPVPAMLVQTLVENGIKHGLSKLSGGGEIAIATRVTSQGLCLDVGNTAGPAGPAEGREGIGMANAAERLQLLFGSEATLRLDRSAPGWTTASVRIPTPPRAMKVVIVDDERLARAELKRLLAAHPGVEVAGEAANSEEARALLGRVRPDVMLLDIEMPGGTGFDLLSSLDEAPRVIFTTAYDEHAVRAFKVNALDYLLKPIEPARLSAALERARASGPEAPRGHRAGLRQRRQSVLVHHPRGGPAAGVRGQLHPAGPFGEAADGPAFAQLPGGTSRSQDVLPGQPPTDREPHPRGEHRARARRGAGDDPPGRAAGGALPPPVAALPRGDEPLARQGDRPSATQVWEQVPFPDRSYSLSSQYIEDPEQPERAREAQSRKLERRARMAPMNAMRAWLDAQFEAPSRATDADLPRGRGFARLCGSESRVA